MKIFTGIACAIIMVIPLVMLTSPTCYANDKSDGAASIPSSAYGVIPTTTLHSGSTVPGIASGEQTKVIPDIVLNRPLVVPTAIVRSDSTVTPSSLVPPVTSSTSFVPPAVVIPPGASE